MHVDYENNKGRKGKLVATNLPGLRGLLGLAGYYRHFIKAFEGIQAALHASTSRNKKFEWSRAKSAVFDTLEEKHTSPPAIPFTDFVSPLILETNALSFALRAALAQKKENANTNSCNTQAEG